MFTVNDHCSSPMHILLADILESQGSTTLLHQVMNRLGVCASADTLSRFMQNKVETSNWLITDNCDDSEPFTIISADNIDFLHKYARIAGNKKTSWHGTTVQAVQPQPSLSIFTSSHIAHSDPVSVAALPYCSDSTSVAALPSSIDSASFATSDSVSTASSMVASHLDPATVVDLVSRST